MLLSLNPFEFRAGIYFLGSVAWAVVHSVLIPLNSGLVFTLFTRYAEAVEFGLNPFEFRAGIYLYIYLETLI